MLTKPNRPTLAQLVERLTVDVITFVKKSNQNVTGSIPVSRKIKIFYILNKIFFIIL